MRRTCLKLCWYAGGMGSCPSCAACAGGAKADLGHRHHWQISRRSISGRQWRASPVSITCPITRQRRVTVKVHNIPQKTSLDIGINARLRALARIPTQRRRRAMPSRLISLTRHLIALNDPRPTPTPRSLTTPTPTATSGALIRALQAAPVPPDVRRMMR